MQVLDRGLGLRGHERPSVLDLEHQPGKRGPETVMEVPAEPPTFLLTRENKPLPRAPDVLGQGPRVQQQGNLGREVLQDAQVGCAKRGRGPGIEQVPGTTAVRDQRDHRGGGAGARQYRARHDRSCGVAEHSLTEPERVAQFRHDVGQQAIGPWRRPRCAGSGRPGPHRASRHRP